MQTNIEAAAKTRSWFRRIINAVALAYLLLMSVYIALRLTVGDGNTRLALVNSFAYLLFLPLFPLLLLTLVSRNRKALLYLLPILLLLLTWIAPRFIPKPAITPVGSVIRVYAANTWVSNSLPQLLDERLRDSQADILCITEVTPTFADNYLPDLTTLYPYQAVQRDTTRPGDTYTLSRYPIVSTETISLGISGFPEPQRVVINIDGYELAVYTVHLAWPLADDAINASGLEYYVQLLLAFDDRIRNQQIDQLLAHLANEPLPYIVAGDFNMSDFSATYNRLTAVMHDSFLEGGQGMGGSWPVTTHNNMPKWLPPLMRIDYIWHSDGIRTIRAWQGEAVGSDHLPLLAELALDG